MKVVCLFLIIAIFGAWAAPLESTTFSTKYDHLDIFSIIDNSRLFTRYFQCLKGAGKCTPEGSLLKEALPSALKEKCAPCSDKQKEIAKKALPLISKKYPKEFKELEDLYDPEGIYRKEHAKLAADHGVQL